MENNTIFDDVFRTMLEKCQDLLFRLLMRFFILHILKMRKINQYHNEHHTNLERLLRIHILASVINYIIWSVRAVPGVTWDTDD